MFNCPACKGTGTIHIEPNSNFAKAKLKQQAGRALLDAGFSLRQVQKLIGWKDLKSVQRLRKGGV